MPTGMLAASRVAPLVALLTAALWLTGCGSSATGNKTKVTGKVTSGGKQVAGSVTFVDSANKEYASPISPEGVYTIADVPPGTVKVLVKGTPKVNAPTGTKLPDMPGQQAASGVDPPAKYATATGGLTYEVKNGEQTFDIDLKP